MGGFLWTTPGSGTYYFCSHFCWSELSEFTTPTAGKAGKYGPEEYPRRKHKFLISRKQFCHRGLPYIRVGSLFWGDLQSGLKILE